MNKLLRIIPILFVLYSCVPVIGTATVGVIKTGVQISEDPRTFGTIVDDNIIEKSYDNSYQFNYFGEFSYVFLKHLKLL